MIGGRIGKPQRRFECIVAYKRQIRHQIEELFLKSFARKNIGGKTDDTEFPICSVYGKGDAGTDAISAGLFIELLLLRHHKNFWSPDQGSVAAEAMFYSWANIMKFFGVVCVAPAGRIVAAQECVFQWGFLVGYDGD